LGEPGGYDSDDEEDPELPPLTGDTGGVRNLAVNDWAQIRILDGQWYSPAGQYFGHQILDKPTAIRAPG